MAAALWPQNWLDLANPVLAVVVVVVAFVAIFACYKTSTRSLCISLLAGLAGAGLFIEAVTRQQANMLSAGCDNQTITAEFKITRLPEQKGRQQRLWVSSDSDSLKHCFKTLPASIRLSYWQPQQDLQQPLRQGDTFTASVKLRRPHSNSNPGGFDYVAWLWRKGVSAGGYIKSLESVAPADSMSLRDRLRQQIDRVLAGHPAKGWVEALSFGYRANVTPPQWQQARETGLAHLLAISGLHLGLVAGALLLLMALVAKIIPRDQPWPSLVLFAPALVGTAFYATLAGWPLSTQRAWLMLCLFVFAAIVNWRLPKFMAWAVAALLCLMWQPLNVIDAGFYLSFAAVWVLLWFSQAAQTLGGKLWLACKLQFALLLGMLPLQLWFFGGFSLLSVPMNLVFVPLLALLLLPALLIVCAGLLVNLAIADIGLIWIADSLYLFQQLLEWVHQATAGYWFAWQALGRPPAVLWLLILAATLIAMLPRGLGLRIPASVALIAALIGLFKPSAKLTEGEFSITAFDAGQGTTLLVQTHSQNIIYDTGAGWRSGGSAMQSMILPALSALGVKQVDLIVISHSDNDHAGGLSALLEQYPGTEVIGGETRHCGLGLKRQVDKVQIDAVWPLQGTNKDNDDSCVLKISSPYGSALLTGDISRAVEAKLLQQPVNVVADWLLVPHHGSKTSSSKAFIKAVRPSVAVITSGYNNRYQLPASEVTERYQQLLPGLKLLNTGDSGAVTTQFSLQCRPCVTTQRQQRRWWQ
jgi:competence protein ComEC